MFLNIINEPETDLRTLWRWVVGKFSLWRGGYTKEGFYICEESWKKDSQKMPWISRKENSCDPGTVCTEIRNVVLSPSFYQWPCLATVGRDHIHGSWTAKHPLTPSHCIHSGPSLSSHNLLPHCPASDPSHPASTGFLKLAVVDSEMTSLSV